jgi:hypothetical protein
MSTVHGRHFVVNEAQALLAELRPSIQRIAELMKEMVRRGYDVYKHQYFGGIGPNGQKAFPPELEELVELLRTLDNRGIQVKDPAAGLIDFPHLRGDGEEVYLCYRLDEPAIGYWHTLQGGFAARETLDTL